MTKKKLISVGALFLLGVALLISTIVVQGAHASKATSGKTHSLFEQKIYPTYVVHGIPGVPVDVYVNGNLTISNFQPGTTAGPFNLPNSYYQIALYTVGADPTTTSAIVKTPVPVQSTLAPVSIIARLGANGRPTLEPIVETLDFAGFPGEGMIITRNASADQYPGFFYCVYKVGSSPFIPLNSFTAYQPAGKYVVSVVPFGATSCANPFASTVVTVESEVDLNAYVVGSRAAGTLQIIAQSLPDEGDGR